MKILHVIDSAGIYGAEVMLLNLMSEQIRMGLKPILLSIESESAIAPPDIVKESVSRGIEVIRMAMRRGYNKNDGYRILACAEHNAIDLIHSHGYKSDILLGFIPRRKRKIHTLSTVHGWISVRMFTKIWIYNFFDKIALRRLDAIVYVNPSIKNVVKHKNPFYIENGIPECDFTNRPDIEHFFTDKNSNQFVIGSISRLSEEKGLVHLLEAVKQLLSNGIDIKLAILGDGVLRAEYERFISENNLQDRIIMLGYRPKAFSYLPYFDIFVLPSLTEGLPITILEAMQAEVPIIATNVGAIPHVLDNGKYGRIVNSGNKTELANAIKYVIGNYNEALEVASQARIHAQKNFSSKEMAMKYSTIYSRIINK